MNESNKLKWHCNLHELRAVKYKNNSNNGLFIASNKILGSILHSYIFLSYWSKVGLVPHSIREL